MACLRNVSGGINGMVSQSSSCPVGKKAMMAKVFLELHERESGLPSIKSRIPMYPARQDAKLGHGK